MKRSFTLVELIIAIFLMASVILAAMAFNLASNEFFASSTKKGSVLNDLTFLLEHIQKNVFNGIGDINNPAIEVVEDTTAGTIALTIKQDMNVAGIQNNTPQDYSDDRQVKYIFDYTNYKVIFKIFDSGGSEAHKEDLANKLNNDDGSLSISVVDLGVKINNLNLRLDPAKAVDDRHNPQVSIDEQFFFSSSHSMS
ncbi:MAG: hypothetical protein KJ619_02930 [Candidatus Omnitrophica bacterium]|nr:hypothetical protein [Candidatus Omnitrophota bacterium]MBU2251443.1 hypothetical protein [Candidatus Omnitrophota bacterium]